MFLGSVVRFSSDFGGLVNPNASQLDGLGCSKNWIQVKYQVSGSGTKTSIRFFPRVHPNPAPESITKIVGSDRKEWLNFLNWKKSKYNF